MITGVVSASKEAVVVLDVHGPAGQIQGLQFVVDTGFTGFLTLPYGPISSLGLPWLSRQQGTLADGSTELFDVYAGTVIWDGQARHVEVDAADADPLLGMGLLSDFELNVQVRPGGAVTIKALP